MAKKMLIDATHPEETRVVVVDGSRIEEFDYETVTKVQISGNIYLAKVTRVEPSLQAAFVEYGGSRHGFLAFAEIHPDYYQIPVADREALLAAERAAHEAAARDEDNDDRGRRERRGVRSGARSDSRGAGQNGDGAADKRRRGRRRDGGRRRGLQTAAFASEEQLSEEQIALATDGSRLDGPSRTALLALAEANGGFDAFDAAEVESEAETAPNAESSPEPDLSDVVEIEIRRAPSESEAAAGHDVVVEKIDLSALAQSPASDGPRSADAKDDAGDDAGDDAAQSGPALAEAAGAAGSLTIAEPPADAALDDDEEGSTPRSAATGDAEADRDAYDPEDPTDDRESDAEETGDEPESTTADAPAEEIETLGDDDSDREEEMQPRRVRLRDYRIQEVIKRRQIMLVQVVKEERGNKGAALTTYLSLAGRYCVLMPNTARGGGISRKITNAADRKRLKAVTQELEVPEGMGLIVRTAGANRTKAEIKRDFEYLLRQWSAIRDLTLKSIAPCLIYEEGSLVKRAIRDLYNKDIEAVLVEGEDAYREAKDYMKMLMPSHAKHVQPFREATPLFARHQIENQIGAMMNPTVPLKSGGYLVIGVTEALVAIDVNSGRSTKEGSIEDTALKTNLEAADEAARQMRLRDLAGLIVIDFIDMEESKNNRAVEKRLKDRLKDDRARIQVGRISGFGLLEMSRQRLRPGLLEATTQPCPHCKGTGLVRSEESMALAILRAIEEEAGRKRSPAIRAGAPISVANYLMNQKRARIAMMEERHGIQVLVEGDPAIVSPDFAIERVKPIAREEPVQSAIQLDAVYDDLDPIEDEDEAEPQAALDQGVDDEQKPEARRRRRRKRSDAEDGSSEPSAAETADAEGDEDGDAATDRDEGDLAASEEDEPRRRRGRRGGRRRRRRDEAEDEASAELSGDDGEPSKDDPESENAAASDETDPLPVFGLADEAQPPSEEDDSNAETSDVDAAPPVAGAEKNGAEAGAVIAETDAPPSRTAEPRSSDAKEQDLEKQLAHDALDDQIDAKAPAEPKLTAEPREEPRPRRVGWWSLGRQP